MKIAFVHPKWTEGLGTFWQLGKKRSPAPNCGILYLAAVAEKRGHEVEIIDCEVEDFTMEDVTNYLLQKQFDIIGITATTIIFHKAVQLATSLKEHKSHSLILIGGTHFNIFKKQAFHDCFDYGFFGESEYAFDQFIEIVESKMDDFRLMKGFVYRRNGQVVEAPPSDPLTDLDALRFPAVHLLKLEHYVVSFARKYKPKLIVSVVPTRGCPFKCAFCCEPLLNNKLRMRSPKNVVDEIEKWHKELGATHFWFSESNMTLKRSRIEGICHEIIDRKLEITFEGSSRANLVDEKLLRLMKSAGLIRISYGLESGDPEVLRIIRKEVDIDELRRATKLSDELDIETNVTAILGLPGDTRASVNRTINVIRNTPHALYTTLGIANPYPGSEMYDWSLNGQYGFHLIEKDFSKFSRYDSSPVMVNDLSQEDLVRLQKIGLLKIHLTPKRMIAAVRMIGFIEITRMFINLVWGLLEGFVTSTNKCKN